MNPIEKSRVFQTPRRYEVISSVGKLAEEGYFVCNNVPVTDEGRPVFEHQFSTAATGLKARKVSSLSVAPPARLGHVYRHDRMGGSVSTMTVGKIRKRSRIRTNRQT